MVVLSIHLNRIAHNYQVAANLCHRLGIELAVVVKSCSGNSVILEALVNSGMMLAADTHPENLIFLDGIHSISLLNPPSMIHRRQICDEMYISSWPVLKEASEAHVYNQSRIIIPVDMGDHRDGIPAADFETYIKQARKLPDLNIAGLSANWGCMMMSCPEQKQLEDFGLLVDRITKNTGWQPEVVSVGGSSIIHYLSEKTLPETVTRLRLGEAIFMGFNPSLKQPVTDMYNDAFCLEAEIVEALEGGHPQGAGWADIRIPEEDGVSRRAILDIGYSSVDPEGLRCTDDSIRILRCSQDHLVVGSDTFHFEPGNTLAFQLDYHAFSRAVASPWVRKNYIPASAMAVA